MKLVIDTNILLVSISPKSKYFPIFKAFQEEKYTLSVTSDILIEYEEIFKDHVGYQLAESTLLLIENAPNTNFVNRYYKWNMITNDPDDNKFIDCAIASNADYIVSNDRHFDILKKIKFPQIVVLEGLEFLNLLSRQ